jgi:hypothetical protein
LTVYDLVILAPAFLLLADWGVGEDISWFSQSSHLCRKERGKDEAPALLADGVMERKVSSSSLPMLLYISYALPLIGPLSRYTHVQLSVLAFVGLVFFVWRGVSRESATAQIRG